MDPSRYVPAYLERLYLDIHPDLTSAARALVHEEILKHPEKHAETEHARALVAYMRIHDGLLERLGQMEDLPDDEFEARRARLFSETRRALLEIAREDRLAIDAELVAILLADTDVDSCLSDLMHLEARVKEHLIRDVEGFDPDAPAFWSPSALERASARLAAEAADGAAADGADPAAELTRTSPSLVGWLHVLEAISQLSIATARYRAAIRYARLVMRASGYPSHAEGTVLIAHARLEEEEEFFAAAAEAGETPWFLLTRTLLLYKLGRRKAAKRALRDFVSRCDGGAFFLLNPTYLTPYLPVRPEPRESWDLTHQAVWESDGLIADTPDFVAWAEQIDGVYETSEAFASRNGF